jgi:hypothetical protein
MAYSASQASLRRSVAAISSNALTVETVVNIGDGRFGEASDDGAA